MKKLIAYLTTILTLCSLSAAFAFAEPSASDDHPGALFLPSSYEQYLELNEPSDFAISDRYVAIADSADENSSVLYLYDKQISSYRRLDFQSGKISSVCFYNNYEGNIYGLCEGSVQKYDIRSKETTATPLNLENYVYSQHTLSALSFAFGLSDGSAYILSDGFIVRTDLGISTLNNISADGLYNSLYGTQPSKDDLIVEVKAGSVAVSLDIKSLESDSAYLPYRSYRRLEEDRKGVVLGETDAGYVVLFYEYIPVGEGITSPIHTYDVCLIAKGSAETPAIVADYFSEIKKTGYLSSDVNLYSRPAMQEFTIKDRLKRSSAVAVLGKVSLADGSLDNEYYFVQVGDAYGFIPATFVTDANIAALDNENFHYQQLKKGKSVTLESEQGARITLENKERLKVYDGATDKEGYCLVSYEQDGVVYFGEIESSSLSEASPLVIVTLVIVMVVTAAVLLSVCYLLLRRKPTLE